MVYNERVNKLGLGGLIIKKVFKENKVLVWTAAVLIVILTIMAGVFYYFNVQKLRSSTKQTTNKTQQSENIPSGTIGNSPVNGNSTGGPGVTTTYVINDLNKKEGDPFALPDEVKLSVSPTVAKVNVSLVLADGRIAYSQDVAGSSVDQIIYPNLKIVDGSNINLVIKAYVADKIVVSKTVGVIFQ